MTLVNDFEDQLKELRMMSREGWLFLGSKDWTLKVKACQSCLIKYDEECYKYIIYLPKTQEGFCSYYHRFTHPKYYRDSYFIIDKKLFNIE